MEISLLLFAGLRDAVGERTLRLQMADGATLADLKQRLAADYPAVAPMLKTAAFAIDDEYVKTDVALREGTEVALIPPVSGGDDDLPLYKLTYEAIESAAPALAERVRTNGDGAVALFYGVVRNNSEGKDVERLEYEAHESMALAKMREVGEETKHRFPEITEIGVWHRIGTLEIGETSLLVAVSSPHRKEALDACHWAVDYLKQVVPVWKKEHWAGGAAWVPGHAVGQPEA